MKRQSLTVLAGVVMFSSFLLASSYDTNNLGDIMVADGSGVLSWYEYNGTVSFVSQSVPSVTGICKLAGYNDGGKGLGTLMVGLTAGGVADYTNNGTHAVTYVSQPIPTAWGTPGNAVAVGDTNGDGYRELYARWENAGSTAKFAQNSTSNGIFDYVIGQYTSYHQAVQVGSFRSKTSSDMFIANDSLIMWTDGDGNWKNNLRGPSGSGWTVWDIALGNFDGDAHQDMFVLFDNGANGKSVYWVENTGENTYEYVGSAFGTDVSCVEVGDINGDGISELLLGHSAADANWYVADGNNAMKSITGWNIGYVQDVAFFVPEPASMVLLGFGAVFMVRRLRK